MILELRIKNYITINECHLEFNNGLTVITGESGAGKSIIFNAIRHLFGKSLQSDNIGSFGPYCEIEGIFKLTKAMQKNIKSEFIDDEHPDQLIIYKKTTTEKSISRLNNKAITQKQLKEITNVIGSIISQNQQSILDKNDTLISVIDSFFNSTDISTLKEYHLLHQSYKTIKKQLNDIKNITNIDQELEFLNYQINDIDQYQFTQNEDLELEKNKKTIKNQEKYQNDIKQVGESIAKINQEITNIENISTTLSDIKLFETHTEQLDTHTAFFNDFNELVHTYLNQLDTVSDQDLDSIEQRLDIIFKQKNKYKVHSINQLLDHLNSLKKKKESLRNVTEEKENIEKKLNKISKDLTEIALKLHEKRNNIITQLETNMTLECKDLQLPNATIKFINEFHRNQFYETGCNQLSLAINLNKGTSLKSLTKSASGGERSRLLLAIYCVLAKQTTQKLLLFDEIDTGVGGITANDIGTKLKQLAQTKQIICITHLPQIAQCSDYHIIANKYSNKSNTTTELKIITSQQKSEELLRMIGGKKIKQEINR